MADTRLPIPGSDDGSWGAILNDYLSQSHTSAGVLKDNAVGTNQIQPGAVTRAKLDSTVAASLDNADAAVSGTAPNASGSTPGLVQLTGDLGGTYSSPTVPTLANKADDSTVMHRTGSVAEAISGVKTFSSAPILPLTGIVKATGASQITTATAGTDYLAPNGNGSQLTGITQSQVSGLATALTAKVDTPSSGTASSSTYLRGDGTWATPAGGGASAVPTATVTRDTDGTITSVVEPNGTTDQITRNSDGSVSGFRFASTTYTITRDASGHITEIS